MSFIQNSQYAKVISLRNLTGSAESAPTEKGAIFVQSGSLKTLADNVQHAGALTAEGAVSGAAGNFDGITGTSLALQTGGITAAGAIAGATTIDASGKITGNEFATDGDEFSVSTAGAVVAASITGSGNAQFGGTLLAGHGKFSVAADGDLTVPQLTASHAKIGVLDVNTINSITQTNTTLEVADANIIAGAGANTSENADGAGLQVGGNSGEGGFASVLYEHTGAKMLLKVSGSTIADLNSAGLHAVGKLSASLAVEGLSLDIEKAADIGGKLTVVGVSDLDGGINVNDSNFTVGTNGAVVAASLDNSNGGITNAGAIAGATTVSGSGKATSHELESGQGTFTVSKLGAMVAATAKVSDLTSGRVLLAGTSGELEDSENLTFDGSKLQLTGGLVVDGLTANGSVGVGFQDDDDITFASVTKNALNLKAGSALLSFNNMGASESAKLNYSSDQLIISSSKDVQVQAVGIFGVTSHTHLSGTLQVDDAASLSSGLTVAGATVLNGDVTLGDAVGDAININGAVTVANTALPFTVNSNIIRLGNAASDQIAITGSLTLDGDIVLPSDHSVTAEAFHALSDRGLKQDIAPMDGALEKVMKLEPVTYELKSKPGIADLGFIAQDVAKIVPEICSVDAQGIGRAIDYGRMSALLAGAVKTQQTQIDELKAVIEKLQK